MTGIRLRKPHKANFTGTRFDHVGAYRDSDTLMYPTNRYDELNITLVPVSKSNCRIIVLNFIAEGSTSPRDKAKSWVVLEYCRVKNIKYIINCGIVIKV